MSAEAIVGTGITIAAIGVLFLMLGWAQHMREVYGAAWILLMIGAVLFVLGAVAALLGRSGRKRVSPAQAELRSLSSWIKLASCARSFSTVAA